jgi:hypothetical protein
MIKKKSHTGVSKCRKCNALNPWRSDFMYGVGNAIQPGFLGECRTCEQRGFQDVVRITESLDAAEAFSTS